MNIKNLLITFVFALITAWGIQYFILSRWIGDDKKVVGTSSFIAPQSEQVAKPLNVEVDFIDAKRPKITVRTTVETPWGECVFSTDGATLERLVFKRIINGKEQFIGTIFPPNDTEREERCFLVAIQEKTPFFYNLVDRNDGEQIIRLTYQAITDDVVIKKIFVVSKDVHKIDLKLEITPKNNEQELEARIFYPSPFMPEIEQADIISSVVVDGVGSFEKTAKSSLSVQKGWFSPAIFGSDSRYIIHAMTNDHNSFVQRAYYKFADKKIFSVLEGPVIDKKTSWMFSFYFGPKELAAITAVDSRFESTLQYSGIFAPISKLLLSALTLLYKYVPNYGLAIILLTLLIKLLMLPFSLKSEKGMRQRTQMQKKLAYIKQKYKNDSQTLAREQAELIRKHGMPGLGSCLPLFLQIPIFFALSRVLAGSIELYQAPMLWISDLSAKDPYYIFPILVTGGMLAQAATADSQQRMSIVAMALVFGAITASLSSGLALYISVSTLLGVAQTRLLKYFNIV